MESIDIKKYIRNLDPVTGCSIGCSYCYARINNKRFPVTDDFSVPEFVERRLNRISTKKPNVYLMTSASDFSVWKEEWRDRVFDCMKQNKQHTYLFLTKRPGLIDFSTEMANVWLGVTVTNSEEKERISLMRENMKALHYFITFEPLHEDIGKLDLTGIEWIVIGTETGRRKGKIEAKPEWIKNITEQAHALNIPVFMKALLEDAVGEQHLIQKFPDAFHDKFKFD